jgi:hypothetical protein
MAALYDAFDLAAGQPEAVTRDVTAARAGAAARECLPTRARPAMVAALRHILPIAWFERLGDFVRRMPSGGRT